MLFHDPQLLMRIGQQDAEAFGLFYDRYASRAFGLILHILRNRPDAEDVLQETFWQVWRQAERFSARRATAEAWVLMIARSRAVDRLRKRRDTTPDEWPEPTSSDTVASRVERAEDVMLLNAALSHLSPEQQKPIRLAFFEGMTHEQIARLLEIPLGTVKTRIRSGLIRLRDELVVPQELHST